MTLMTPAGMPARCARSASASAENGVCDAGRMTTGHPAARAGSALAGDHRGREVPRRDGGDHADRLLQHHDPPARQRVVDDVAVDALALLGEPLDEGRRVGDLSARFRQGLALLAGHQHREVFLVLHHQLEPATHEVGPLLGRPRPPCGPGRVGRLDGGTRLPGAQCGDGADDLSGRGVVHVERRAVRRIDPFAVHVALPAKERGVAEGDFRLGIHVRVSEGGVPSHGGDGAVQARCRRKPCSRRCGRRSPDSTPQPEPGWRGSEPVTQVTGAGSGP